MVLVAGWLGQRLINFAGISAFATAVIFVIAAFSPRQYALPAFQWNRYWPSLMQYVDHLWHGTFGYVYERPPRGGGAPEVVPTAARIGDLLAGSLPDSLVLFGCALVVGLGAGLLLGLLASRFSSADTRRGTLNLNLTALSIPDVLLVVLVQFLMIYLIRWTGIRLILPFGTPLGDLNVKHMILPVLMLSVYPAAYAGRLSVAAFDEVFTADYIRTARSKGVGDRRIKWAHAFRNAVIPILGGMPVVTGLMISNLIMVEYLMNILGVGRMLVYEVMGDRLQAGPAGLPYPSPNLVASIVICLAAVFVLVDGVADMLLLALDPRVRDARLAQRAAGTARKDRWRWQLEPEVAPRVPRPSLREVAAAARAWIVATLSRLHPRNLPEYRAALARYYKGNSPLVWGTVIVGLIVVVAFTAPLLTSVDPNAVKLVIMNGRDFQIPPYPPSRLYPLGSDAFGRDLLSLVLHGTRYTLLIAGLIVPLRLLIALPVGLAAGWFGGAWERWVHRAANVLGALPPLLIPALLIPPLFPPQVPGQGGAAPAPRFLVLLVHGAILVLIGWPRLAESIRLMTRELAARPFVEGAIAVGVRPRQILSRHILPHLKPQLAVMFAAEMAWVMMLMAQLAAFEMWIGGGAFATDTLGIITPNFPDWSTLLGRPVRYLMVRQWVLIVPGVAFFIAILGFHLLAEGIRRVTLQTGGLMVEADDDEEEKVRPAS